MVLTQQQIEAYDKDGYLFFPELFTPEKRKNSMTLFLNCMIHEAYNVKQKGNQAVRTNFAAHPYRGSIARLG